MCRVRHAGFAADPRTDFGHHGTIVAFDIFSFLHDWFAGCT